MDLHQEKERIIIIDEVQKIDNWSELVKKEWDADTRNGRNIKAILLGSSRVLLQKGLEESLAGRFETIKMGYWDLKEMQEAFGSLMKTAGEILLKIPLYPLFYQGIFLKWKK